MGVFEKRASGTWVEARGLVTRLLNDDRDIERHQRFIVTVGGQTLLIAHNLEVATRVPLGIGDRIRFRGIYEWNDEGGMVHWTHRDPLGDEAAGFIRHRGKIYG